MPNQPILVVYDNNANAEVSRKLQALVKIGMGKGYRVLNRNHNPFNKGMAIANASLVIIPKGSPKVEIVSAAYKQLKIKVVELAISEFKSAADKLAAKVFGDEKAKNESQDKKSSGKEKDDSGGDDK